MPVTQFVGRRGELERLGQVLRGDPGAARVAVVTGDAGIGKTRLLAEAVSAAPEVLVLAGACLPLSELLPYGAITDALAGLASPSRRPALDRALGRCAPYVRPQMAALIPALSDEPRGSLDASADRTRLFAAFKDLLGALSRDRRTAMVVEDLHWADQGTLDLLTFLLHGRIPDGCCLVVTSRRDEFSPYDRVLDWLASALRAPGVETVALASLSDDEVEVLITSLVDSEPTASFLADMVHRGEGNPFFTEQLVAAANDVAPLEMPPGVPPGVAQMLLGRVRSSSATATEVAAALAVAARPLAEAELSVCVGPAVKVAAGLRELLDCHLVETADDDRYRLRHALLEDTVRGTLLSSQRASLHAGVAAVLAARAGESPSEVAAHWRRAGRHREEASWSVAAARHAEGVFAWREASAFWRRIWELWSSQSEDELPYVELSDAVVGCVRNASKVDLASDRADSFLDLAREALADERVGGDDFAVGQLLYAYGYRLGLTDKAAGWAALERAVGLFERAGRPAAEHALAIRLLVNRRIGIRADRDTTGTEDDDLALAADIAERAGALGAALELEADRADRLLASGRIEEAFTVLAQVRQRATDSGSGPGRLVADGVASDGYLWLLRLWDGVDTGRLGIEAALRDGGLQETFRFSVLVTNTVECLLLLGKTAAASTLVDRFWVPEFTIHGWSLHLSRAELDLLAGDLAVTLRSVEQGQGLDSTNEEYWLWLAEIGAAADLWSGDAQSARVRIDPVLARIRSSPMAVRAGRMLALAAWAAADLADIEPTLDREGQVRQLRRWADEVGCYAAHPRRILGAAYGTTFDAELARLRRAGEELAWRSAKETWASHGVPHHAAYAGWRLSERLLDAGRRKDAEAELNLAYTAAETHLPLRGEIEGLARRARLTLHFPGPVPATDTVADAGASTKHGLTAREVDVLRLLGTGATNAEIGRQLYMSPKTASVHVSAILRKLGVTGRVQAATVAERMGLLV